MRVNVYAEEMTNRVEIISKEIEGKKFTGLRFYLELPGTFYISPEGNPHPVGVKDKVTNPIHLKAPFIHHPGDDDSSAVTFWGKKDLRQMLYQALDLLDRHYGEPME